jgi:hypothetical protein
LQDYFQHIEEPSTAFSGPGVCGSSVEIEGDDSWGPT